MPKRTSQVPKYRLKKVHNRTYAAVTLPDGAGGRRDILLGQHGTPESRAAYARAIAEWEASNHTLPHFETTNDLTLNELMARYWQHAENYYRHADGAPTNEQLDLRLAFRPLKAMYGHTPACKFGPLALKAIREQLITQPITTKIKNIDPATGKKVWIEKTLRVGLARGVINQRINRIRRLFRWGVENELVPSSVLEGLRAVKGLQRGRTAARETAKVRPVSVALVEDTLPHLSSTVADMVRIQLATGMRSGEVVIIRACDIDMTGPVWIYKPTRHKMEYQGFERVVALGPKAQEIIKRYLKSNTEAYLFSPHDSILAFRQRLRKERKSPVQPSQVCRAKPNPNRKPGDRYEVRALAHAVRRACDKHGLDPWHPHQLRHTKATEIRREFGLDAARATLGHHGPAITNHYAELDAGKIMEVARKLG
ncbi:MAG: tyrosine-type recombinase/integrase [Gemmataceae bacterium]